MSCSHKNPIAIVNPGLIAISPTLKTCHVLCQCADNGDGGSGAAGYWSRACSSTKASRLGGSSAATRCRAQQACKVNSVHAASDGSRNAEGQCWCYRAGAGQEMRQALCRACIVGEPAPFGGCSGCRWKVVPACGLTGVARMALDGLAVVGGGYASVCPGKDVIRVEAAAAVV